MPISMGNFPRQIYATACLIALFITADCSIRGKSQVSYEDATQWCATFGKGFNLEDPSSNIIFGKGGVRAAWLPYTRTIYKDYKWVDDTHAETTIISIGNQLGYACGALDLENGQFDFLPCNQMGGSFLCQIKGCLSCHSIDMTQYECFVLGNDCYTFNCGSPNWYRARESCLKLGGDLALVKDKNVIPHFNRFWKLTYQGPCNTAWVGLSKEIWKTKEGELPKSSYWAEDEPADIGNCSIIFMDRGEMMWQAVSCKDYNWFFCTSDEVTSTSKRNSEDHLNHGLSASTPNPYNLKDRFSASTVSIATLVISVVIFLFILILMRKNIKHSRRLNDMIEKGLSAIRSSYQPVLQQEAEVVNETLLIDHDDQTDSPFDPEPTVDTKIKRTHDSEKAQLQDLKGKGRSDGGTIRQRKSSSYSEKIEFSQENQLK